MNEQYLQRIFEAARRETPPVPSADFDAAVMRAVRHEKKGVAGSIFDQLNLLFPRLAWVSICIVAVSLTANILAVAYLPSLTDGVVQLSNHWLFALNGF